MKINGWIPDLPDHRDVPYEALRPQNRLYKAVARPAAKYLKADNLPRVYNQGSIGSCVGHGVAECCSYAIDYNYERADGKLPGDLSRLFAYYNARGNKGVDEGAYIREGVKAVAKYGICDEKFWPYDERKWMVKPPDEAYEAAAHRARGISYYRIEKLGDLLDCIAQGYPIVFGMMLFESFDEARITGRCPMPSDNDEPVGGHCMVIVGYSMKQRAFYVRNSWGDRWGDRGNVWVPFDYMTMLGNDFWTIRRIAK